jgi:NADH:ubiquinone oxidoreductase subunit H
MELRYGILGTTRTTAQSIAFEHLFLVPCLDPYLFPGQLNPLATVT